MHEDALAPNQSLWIQIPESFAPDAAFIRHSICLKAVNQTYSHKKETQKERTATLGLTAEPELLLEHVGEAEGSGTLCPCLAALGTEAALGFDCLTAPACGSQELSSGPQHC